MLDYWDVPTEVSAVDFCNAELVPTNNGEANMPLTDQQRVDIMRESVAYNIAYNLKVEEEKELKHTWSPANPGRHRSVGGTGLQIEEVQDILSIGADGSEYVADGFSILDIAAPDSQEKEDWSDLDSKWQWSGLSTQKAWIVTVTPQDGSDAEIWGEFKLKREAQALAASIQRDHSHNIPLQVSITLGSAELNFGAHWDSCPPDCATAHGWVEVAPPINVSEDSWLGFYPSTFDSRK